MARTVARVIRWPVALIESQIREIAQDEALHFYGAALASIATLTSVYWLIQPPYFSDVVAKSTFPVCWPFFSKCASFRFQSPERATVLLLALSCGGLFNAAIFLTGRIRTAWGLLCVLFFVKMALVLLDYRLMLNQHYMASWVTFAFLFVPGKRRLVPLLLVLFYVWAGALKFNHEWLSGDGLYGLRPFGMPSSWIPAACAYVIVLEIVIAPGLLVRRGTIFWSALSQLVLFHISSFWVVGFFYPILMFLLLAIFPLARARPGPPRTAGHGPAITAYAYLASFCLAQGVPHMFPGDPSVTGEGRAFALHMFDAPVECHAQLLFHSASEPPRVLRIPPLETTVRLRCDPLVYFDYAKAACANARTINGGADLDLELDSRKHGEPSYRPVLSIRGFCSLDLTYSAWHHNWWILASPRQAPN